MATTTKKATTASTENKPAVKKIASTTAKKTVAVTAVAAEKATVKKATAKTTQTATPVAQKAAPKTTTRKPAAKKQTTHVSPEQRYKMIADAAYFLAERRGFAGGYEMQDWISAEFEIDAKINA